MFRRGYHEIRTPERVSVRGFLSQSSAYDSLIKIPYTKLNASNKKIYEGICDPLSFIELENEFKKIASLRQDATGELLLFFGSFVSDNSKFEYYLMQLSEEYDVFKMRQEAAPLL